MLDFVAFILGLWVLPVIVNKTTESGRFHWVNPHLRAIWMGIFVFFSVYFLLKDPAWKVAMDMHKQSHWSPWLGYAVSAILGASLLCAYWWAIGRMLAKPQLDVPKEPVASDGPSTMTGTLKPELLFSSQSSTRAILEIGDSGTTFVWAGKVGSPAFMIGEDPIILERIANGNVAITSTIRDKGGKIVAEIVRNEWKLRPTLLWDRNFNSSAVEVRGESGEVILQARALPDRIQLQGIWHTAAGGFVELVKSPDPQRPGGLMIINRPQQRLRIIPIFRYPSDHHLGELR